MITKEIAAIVAEQQKPENVQKRMQETEKQSPSTDGAIKREIDVRRRPLVPGE